MAIWVKIYLSGFIIAFILCVRGMRDEDKRISLSEVGLSILIALSSWITVLALIVGGNIKKAEDERKDNFK